MGEIIPKLAALGITGARFVIAMSVASGMGLTGAAVITTALSIVGGPFGMMGGVAFLVIAPSVLEVLGNFSLQYVLIAVYRERYRKGENYITIFREIDGLWIERTVKTAIKRKIKE